MKNIKTLFAAVTCALAVHAPVLAQASGTVVLKENFNNVGALTNWVQVNNSNPVGQPWFQGNPGVFAAQYGPADSYIGANYLSAASSSGSIDTWLITPELMLGGATRLSFYTRSDTVPGFNDMLEVRFSAGGGTDTGGFSTLL
ncbi:MAG: choice-of-anchor J domain-containing protein, partial [Telluria sp.]